MAVLQKGATDLIASHPPSSEPLLTEIDTPGGLKRCGGQGDILSGAVAAFLAWGKCHETGAFEVEKIPEAQNGKLPVPSIPFLAAAGGAMLTRATSNIGFSKLGRAVVTENLIEEIGGAFEKVFGKGERGSGRDEAAKL